MNHIISMRRIYAINLTIHFYFKLVSFQKFQMSCDISGLNRVEVFFSFYTEFKKTEDK